MSYTFSIILVTAFLSVYLFTTLAIGEPLREDIPIASRSEFCNCTSFLKCELGSNAATSTETASASGEDDSEDGADLEVIDIRLQGPSPSGVPSPCKHYLEICCNHYQHPGATDPKKPASSGNRYNGAMVNGSSTPLQCGRRNSNGVGFRIVGDLEGESQMGEFTWMIAVTEINKNKQGTVYVCGGSLIHPRVVVTAAHCVENKLPENLRVRAGEWDTNTENEDPYIHYDRQISKVILHEEYSKKTVLKNDIALLLLSREVPLARHIGTVCLSSSLEPRDGERCFASGWGKNLFGNKGIYQSILKKVDLPVVERNRCQSQFRETRLGPKFRLHPSFVCAGGQRGKDTCKGDGGSPLVCQVPGSNQYALYGIVSWGLNCGDPIPGAYVNVPHFVPWIESKFEEMGLDSRYFRAT